MLGFLCIFGGLDAFCRIREENKDEVYHMLVSKELMLICSLSLVTLKN